jgi:transcriptional regulator with XRE-family HTH domain
MIEIEFLYMPRKKRDTDFDRRLGAIIRRERKSRGLTMRQLVTMSDLSITEATMWGIESGDQGMSAFQLLKLCSALRIDVDAVFSEVTQEHSQKIEFRDSSNKKSQKF